MNWALNVALSDSDPELYTNEVLQNTRLLSPQTVWPSDLASSVSFSCVFVLSQGLLETPFPSSLLPMLTDITPASPPSGVPP